MKKHEIKTIQDMIKVTNENNLDNFLKDLEAFLVSCHLAKAISELSGVNYNAENAKMIWVDDGKHNITISIKEEE